MTFHSSQRLSVTAVILLATAGSSADIANPPWGAPSWWQENASGTTRISYHNFHEDPSNNPGSDYTINGFVSNFPDVWTLPGATYNHNVAPAPDDPAWGDGRAMLVNGPFSKRFGNGRIDTYIKEYFVAITWKYANVPDDPHERVGLQVDAPAGHTVTPGAVSHFGSDTAGWHHQTWTGTIEPQPDWEDFTFSMPAGAAQGIYVDSLWVGTNCSPIPAPGNLALLAIGGIVATRRRR